MSVRWNNNEALVLQCMLIHTQDCLLLCCGLELSLPWRSVTIRPRDSRNSILYVRIAPCTMFPNSSTRYPSVPGLHTTRIFPMIKDSGSPEYHFHGGL